MAESASNNGAAEGEAWVPALAEFLRGHSGLEAIEIDPVRKRLSFATLGEVEVEALRRGLAAVLQAIDSEVDGGAGSRSAPAPAGLVREVGRGGGTRLSKPTCPTAPELWRWREMPWPEVPRGEGERGGEGGVGFIRFWDDDPGAAWKVPMAMAVACAGAGLAGLALDLAGAPAWAVRAAYLLAMVAGGWDAAHDAAEHLKRFRFDIHFLMLAVAVGAALIGAWAEGALLLFLFSFSGALEEFAVYRTRKEVDALFKSAPEEAVRVGADGSEERVSVGELEVGDTVAVKPGELYPVDGVVLEGKSAADEANLTGESVPVEKAAGDPVFGGTLNMWGALRFSVARPASESSLQKILRLIQEAQHLKAPSQRFTDRFGTRYTVLILGVTAAMFLFWWLGRGLPPFVAEEGGPAPALYRAMTLLVVASPCALVLSIPSAILAAVAWGARRGILFRGGAAVENFAQIGVVALDKTGTLTTGEMVVESVESFPPGKESAVAELAYALERKADHPIAAAIVRYGEREGLADRDAGVVETLPGQGLRAGEGGSTCVIGRRELLEGGPLAEFVRSVPQPSFEFVEVWVIAPDVVGRLLLKDSVRPESKAVLETLAGWGLKTVMLTGDRRETAEAVARELGVQEVRSGLSPAGKVAAVEELKASGARVAMVGDGMNDAPSLAAADVSVAMGARGSDAALEQSEVVLMQDKIENVLQAYRLSRAARAVIKQNLVVSLGTVVVMVGAALTGGLPLSLGVFAHEGSTVLVCLNSLRLLFLK